jgi:phenylacetate-coenzyme A ligase PaaK-like adenylate-forming protein
MSPLDALRLLVRRILDSPSQFYRARLLAAGLQDLQDVDPAALARVPPTRRDELVRDQLAQPPHGSRRFADAAPAVRAGISGSGDGLLVLLWSARDLARERRAGARLFQRLGIQPGMRVANSLPGALATPGALLIGDVIEESGALDIPLGSIESDAAARHAWALVERVQPAVLILEPVSAARLFAAAPAAPRSWLHGIVWRRTDTAPFVLPALPAAVGFAGWQQTWLAIAEATSFAAATCAQGVFHVDDEVLVEVVDSSGAPVSEGTLVLTPFGLDTPVLRYASGLRARVSAPCPCGASGTSVAVL